MGETLTDNSAFTCNVSVLTKPLWLRVAALSQGAPAIFPNFGIVPLARGLQGPSRRSAMKSNGKPKRALFASASASVAVNHIGTILVVEPDSLLRWSLARYLGRWYTVLAVPTLQDAEAAMGDGRVDILIVSDELSEGEVREIECRVVERNAEAKLVRTVVHPERSAPECAEIRLEKPFALSRLAQLLGLAA